MADTADSRKRWDTGNRFTGVAEASSFAPAIADLAALARRPGQLLTKMSSGRNADTSMFGASTTWLIFRSTATLQIA